MSATTAERFLRTQRKPAPHGLSTTKAGTLLKHQIPIRTFHEWDEVQPGFLEADLVAHCGGRVEGSFLYTLTLTDVATGWTECLPLLYKSPETVLAAFHQARQLFPFPIRGLDTDNGGEFINEQLVAYCEHEQITFTRGRPALKNDQCFVEQKNGAIVRQMVGHDRLSGELAYRQLREVYRALRLYVNCFQPSMKRQSPSHDEDEVRRVYDQAKTPLQRLVLSGVLPAFTLQELTEIAQTFDPFGLLQSLHQLQHALFRCAVSVPLAPHSPFTTSLVRFPLQRCTSGTISIAMSVEEGSDPASTPSEAPSSTAILDWSRTIRDPFAREWERILAWVRAHPEICGSEIFRELQRLFPGCYHPSQIGTLYHGLRKIRASLREHWEEPWPSEMIQARVPDPIASELQEHEADPHVGSARFTAAFPAVPSSQLSTEGSPALYRPRAGEEVTRRPGSTTGAGEQRLPQPGEAPDEPLPFSSCPASGKKARSIPLPEMTMDLVVQSYIQDLLAAGRRPKTVEWHQTALMLFQRYLGTECHLLGLGALTETESRGWVVFLATAPSAAAPHRSVRAFCNWLVRQGYLEHTPFAHGAVPKAEHHRIRLLEPEVFDRLLLASHPPKTLGPLADEATARNRAILWVLLETGLLVSELCALRLLDVDRQHGLLNVRGKGARERQIKLSPHSLRYLLDYLDQHRSKPQQEAEGKQVGEGPLFLSDKALPLTPNAITLVLDRLSIRAEIKGKRISPSMLRDTYAVRYLQAGGDSRALQDLLGLEDVASVKRYQHLSDQLREGQKGCPADHFF
jgi:site-specific recombinase XerD